VNPTERIGRLESLLARIRKNVSLPRATPQKAARPVAQPAATPEPPLAAPVAKAEPAPEPPPPPPAPPIVAPAPEPPVAVPSWPPEPPSAVQAAKLSSLPPEELSEDDLLDVTTLPPAPTQDEIAHVGASGGAQQDLDAGGLDVDFDAREDEAPASSSRSKVAETLDQALSGAAERLDDGREVPVKTPPPESGPQEAAIPLSLEQAPVPEITSLEQDLGPTGPTAEQLGDTIELGAPSRVRIELEPQPSLGSPQVDTPDELEVSLPRRELPSGMYDASLKVAPPAEAPREAPAASITPPTDRPPAYPQPSAALGPEATARPGVGMVSVARVVPGRAVAAQSFLETLDASLALEP
jgi:hypothetical protein